MNLYHRISIGIRGNEMKPETTQGNGIEDRLDSRTDVSFRLQRKAIKELFSNAPEGISRDELPRLAEIKGVSGEDFKKVLKSLIDSGHLYCDETLGEFRYVRNE